MADISVANTSSDLSGKTLLTAEGAYTQTGLITFDRDPNPPYAVSSGSAVVPNLDADKVDGLEASALLAFSNHTGTVALGTQVSGNLPLTSYGAITFSSWTPTWTAASVNPAIGNGTLTGTYVQVGKLVFYQLFLTAGSTTTFGTGSWIFTLPATPANTSTLPGSVATATDNSAARSYLTTTLAQSASTIQLFAGADSGAAAASLVQSSVPFTWAQNDSLIIRGWYQAS